MVSKIKGDITELKADVIVNAANTELRHAGGVARTIAKAAGDELEKESRLVGFVPLGGFAVTTAGDLEAKKVIHIPTIDYRAGGTVLSYDDLVCVWKGVLEYCRKSGYTRIATPLLGTGVAGLDRDRVEQTLSQVADSFDSLEVQIVIL